MKKAEAFIIHLDRATNRRAQAEALARRLPLPAQLLEAVDSEHLNEAGISAVYQRALHRPRYPFDLRRQEIACFLSHRKAWQTIVDRGLDAGLIAEDDVDMEDVTASELILAVLNRMSPGDFVRLSVRAGKEQGPQAFASGFVTVIEPRLPGLGMQAQIVGRDAAQKLLKETSVFDRPVDTLIQLPGFTSARVLSAMPVCFSHVDEDVGGSIVQKKQKSFGEIIEREVKRFGYRLAVAAMVRLKTPST